MSYFDFDNFKSQDEQMNKILHLCQQMSSTQANILIAGDLGVGKTSLALYIHKKSKKPKIQILDCRNISSFDFDSSNNATLILENIDQASVELQDLILQKLDTLNTQRPRVISTSRRDLKALVKSNLFRHDLFYKLSVIHLDLPKLHDRKADMIEMCRFILDFTQIIHGKSALRLSAEAYGRLVSWKWPGNIRELENVLERAVILSKSVEIQPEDVVFETTPAENISDFAPGMTLSEVEKRLILQTLEMTAQNRTRAAQMLGISIRTLRNKLNEYKEEGFI